MSGLNQDSGPLDTGGVTDVGQLRSVNEDSLVINPEECLYAVADGMGGHGAGDVASQLAIQVLNESVSMYLNATKPSSQGLLEHCESSLLAGIHAANDRVRLENRQHGFPEGAGMGTTLVGFCLLPSIGRAVTFNVGDSRLYRFRDGALSQITKDHTMYREWQENGEVGPAPPQNIILRAIGLFETVEADLTELDVRENDLLLLCSDGLSGMVDDDTLGSILGESQDTPAEDICQRLVALANANGGEDNVTVVAVRQEPATNLSLDDTLDTSGDGNHDQTQPVRGTVAR